MLAEFWKTIPESIKIPAVSKPVLETASNVFRIIQDGRTTNIETSNWIYSAGEINSDWDMFIFWWDNSCPAIFWQQQEYRLFLILLKYAQQLWMLDEILSTGEGNLLTMLSKYDDRNHDDYFDIVRDVILNINSFIWETEASSFFIQKGPHYSWKKYDFDLDYSNKNLQIEIDGEVEYVIKPNDVIHYLRALLISWENWGGRTNPSRYRQLVEYMFSPESREDYVCEVKVYWHWDFSLIANGYTLPLKENQEVTYFFYFLRKILYSWVPIAQIIKKIKRRFEWDILSTQNKPFRNYQDFIDYSVDIPASLAYLLYEQESNTDKELIVEHKIDEAYDFLFLMLEKSQWMRKASITEWLKDIEGWKITL